MRKESLIIGVIFGGKSFEHEVSLVSARSIVNGLKSIGYEIKLFGIDKGGQWVIGEKAKKLLNGKLQKSKIKSKIGPRVLRAIESVDVFFPVLHGIFGEDGTIQGFLEIIDKPYVGAGVLASACGMDKVIQKTLFKANNLPTPDFVWVPNRDFATLIKKVEKKIGYPCFVKPANSGSSVGISKVKDRKGLIKGVKVASQYDQKILVEKAVKDVREIEVSILGNQKPIASQPGEVIPNREFYDYQAKYINGQSQILAPAKLSSPLIKKFQNLAIQAYKVVDCCGMARIDFLMDNKTKKIYLNEINTIPGFTSISMYPKLWQVSGLSFQNLLKKLIKSALGKYHVRRRIKTSFQAKSLWYCQ